MPTLAPRDEAVQIASAFLSKLFTRAWMTWTPRHEATIGRLIDCIISAAVDQMQRSQDDAFLDELAAPVHPASAKTVSFHRDAESDPKYQAWRERRQGDEESVGRMLRAEGRGGR